MNVINNIRFNQTKDSVSIATNEGFLVYNLDPFEKKIERYISGGLRLVQMLYNTDLFLLVGNGKNNEYYSNKIVIWNDSKLKNEVQIEYNDIVKNVEWREDILVVVLEYKIYVYNNTDYTKLREIHTYNNPLGLVSINYSINFNKKLRLVSPSKKVGWVEVWDKTSKDPLRLIKTHNNKLECIQLNNNGEYLATASNMGTIIRIFNINNGILIKEFRRGIYSKIIHNLVFNEYSNLLLSTTLCGTIDIFKTGLNDEITNIQIEIANPLSNIFNKSCSISKYKIDNIKFKGCFINDYIVILGNNSKYYQFKYDTGLKLYNITNLFFGENSLINN
tara:strand:- start:1087 stop:2085 length:999 start_codon:yes stop_codon:yes gene_type:complete